PILTGRGRTRTTRERDGLLQAPASFMPDSIHLGASALHHVAPLRGLLLHEFREALGGAADQLVARGAYRVLHGGRAERPIDLGIEPGDDRLGNAGGDDDAAPRGHL